MFVVLHTRELSSSVDDQKMIGAYSSREKGESAIARLLKQPGFRDFPDSFSIDEYPIDQDHWQEGFIESFPESSMSDAAPS
ncbi:MAG: hypothetical protein WA902_16040 [Thermosynechococcaceae cyanobacterium]